MAFGLRLQNYPAVAAVLMTAIKQNIDPTHCFL
jgi:hypothetical protein